MLLNRETVKDLAIKILYVLFCPLRRPCYKQSFRTTTL